MFEIFHQVVGWLVHTIGQWGYPGIIALMFLESSFFPFPSEVVIPPAAYLAAKGDMNLGMVILCGTAGSLLGGIFNYGLAMYFGRPFFEKYGKYLLVSHESLEKADRFFERHGYFSMFIGRLLPGIRQYISLPAGIARMNFFAFCSATTLGAGIWVIILAGLGYWFGQNEAMIMQNLHWISIALLITCTALIVVYRWWWVVRARKAKLQNG